MPTFLAANASGFTKENQFAGAPVPLLFCNTPEPSPDSHVPHFSTTHAHPLTSHPLLLARRLWWIVSRPSPICPVLLSQLDLSICLGFSPPQPTIICSAVGEKETILSTPFQTAWVTHRRAACPCTLDTGGDGTLHQTASHQTARKTVGEASLTNDRRSTVLFK